MAEKDFTPLIQPEPELRQTKDQPQGVLKKNLKTFVYLGAALLVIVAAFFSSNGKKTPSQQATKGQPPQPMLQDNTDNNVRDLKNQVQAERQKDQQTSQAAAAQDPALAAASGLTPAQQTAAAAYGPTGIAAPCAPGQPCPQAPPGYGQPNAQPHAHRSGAGDDHACLVWRSGVPCLRPRRFGVQHGEVPEPLHAAHLRLCDGALFHHPLGRGTRARKFSLKVDFSSDFALVLSARLRYA